MPTLYKDESINRLRLLDLCCLHGVWQAMLIVEAYVVTGGAFFVQTHGHLVASCFGRLVGEVRSQQ